LTDRLTEVLRDGARALLTQAVEAEVSEFLAATADLKADDGSRRVVRHGHLPERETMTGIGPVAVRQPRVRDREAGADDPARIRFTPAILPPYARRSKSLDTLIPILYLKGVSTGDFAQALAALLGKDAPGLSATTIARLKEVWQAMERARPIGQELCLRLGGRRSPASASGGRGAVHPGYHRRHAGVQEGAASLCRRGARERPRLARSAARSETPGSVDRAEDRRRRRCARVLESARRVLAQDPRAAKLGA
jgi:Transposase, Mutator family